MNEVKGIKLDGASFNLAFVQTFEKSKDFVAWGYSAEMYSHLPTGKRTSNLKAVWKIAKSYK